MREIRFRAFYEGDPGGLTRGMYYHVGLTPLGVIFFEDVGNHMSVPQVIATIGSEVDGLNIMEYTGLKDKNGKEICEGDIIKGTLYDRDETVIVEHYVGYEGDSHPISGFVICLDEVNQSWESEEKPPMIDGEVIGNIYENPELKP